jgi:chromosome segregation ATPase
MTIAALLADAPDPWHLGVLISAIAALIVALSVWLTVRSGIAKSREEARRDIEKVKQQQESIINEQQDQGKRLDGRLTQLVDYLQQKNIKDIELARLEAYAIGTKDATDKVRDELARLNSEIASMAQHRLGVDEGLKHKGEKGDTGARGPQGDTGARGPQGDSA